MPTGVQVRGWGIVHLVRFPNPLAVGEPDWCPLGPICNIVPSLRLAWCIKIFTFSQLFSAHWCPSERLKWCPLGPMLTMAMSLFFWHGPTFPDVNLCSSFSQPFTTGEGLQHSYGIPVDQTGEKLLFFLTKTKTGGCRLQRSQCSSHFPTLVAPLAPSSPTRSG